MKTAAKDFKMTELGPIPKDWEVKSYEDVFTHIPAKGYQVAAEEYLQGGAYPVVDQGQEPIVGFCNQKEKVYSAGDDGVIVFGDHTRIVKFVDFDFVVGADGTQLLKGKECSTRYLAYILSVLDIPNLGYSRHFKYVKKANFAMPPLPEQRKIAAALSDVDEMVAALEKLIEKKRKIKTGTMQRLLTGKTRLPGFKGAWVEKRLGDCATMFAGGTPSSKVPCYYGGEIPWVSISDISVAGKYLGETENTITEEGLKNSSAKWYPSNALLFAMYASIGKCCIARESVTSSQAILGIYDLREFDLDFLYYTLSYRNEELLAMGQTGTQANLSKEIVSNIIIRTPSTLAEQKAIAKVLGDIDEEIAALESELAKTRQLKQGMMQELLTGKVRLV